MRYSAKTLVSVIVKSKRRARAENAYARRVLARTPAARLLYATAMMRDARDRVCEATEKRMEMQPVYKREVLKRQEVGARHSERAGYAGARAM